MVVLNLFSAIYLSNTHLPTFSKFGNSRSISLRFPTSSQWIIGRFSGAFIYDVWKEGGRGQEIPQFCGHRVGGWSKNPPIFWMSYMEAPSGEKWRLAASFSPLIKSIYHHLSFSLCTLLLLVNFYDHFTPPTVHLPLPLWDCRLSGEDGGVIGRKRI